MADASRDFATDMDDDAHSSNRHIQRLLSSGEGEALKAQSDHRDKVEGKQGNIAGAAWTVAVALDTAASVIEGMKLACIGHLSAKITEAGISLAAAPVTFGLSALISGGAVAATRTVVKKLIKEAGEEAVGLILSALAEPATTAIANFAADLADVQTGANAMGRQNGIDAGQAAQAGKDGFKEGVQCGKQSLHLASAGGGGGLGGLMKDLAVDHGEHGRATTHLNTVSVSVKGRTKGKLNLAKGHHNRRAALRKPRRPAPRPGSPRPHVAGPDSIGGLYACPEPRRANYTAAVCLRTGKPRQALAEAEAVLRQAGQCVRPDSATTLLGSAGNN